MYGAFGRFYRRHPVKISIPAQVYTKKYLESAFKDAKLEPIEVRTNWPICLAAHARVVDSMSELLLAELHPTPVISP